MRPYSMDLRRRVVAAWDRRDGRRIEIAKRFGVSTAWIRWLLQRRRKTVSIAPWPQNAGRKPALDNRRMERLRRVQIQADDIDQLLDKVRIVADLKRSRQIRLELVCFPHAMNNRLTDAESLR